MPPFDAELAQLTDQLTKAYNDAWRQVLAEQQRVAQGIATNPRLWRQRDRLVEMRQRIELEMRNVDALAEAWVTREYPKFYLAGAEKAATQLHSPFSWTQTHRDAVVLLVRDTMDDLLEATAFVRDDTKRFIRAASKAALERGQLVGRTARQTASKLSQFIEARGIHAVRYANGAKHGLADYAEMMVRTKTAVAYNVGTLNQGAEFGVKYYEVFDGPSCGWSSHNDTELANGKIVSAKEAATYVIAHPRCARSFGARPDITTPVVAKGAKPTPGGQELPRPEAPGLPLEAAARTREAREAAAARRTQAGLEGRVRTPQRVMARRAAMLQRGPGAAARGESGLHPQSRRRAKEPPKPTDPFGQQLDGFDGYDDVLERAWANQGETQHLAWDGGDIEDLQLRITRTVVGGEERTMVQFKLREDAKEALESRLTAGQLSDDAAREVGRKAYRQALAEGKDGAEAFRAADLAENLAKQGAPGAQRVAVPKMVRGVVDFADPAYDGGGRMFFSHQAWKGSAPIGPGNGTYWRFYRGAGAHDSYAFDGLVQGFLPGRASATDLARFMAEMGVRELTYPKPSDAFVYVRNRLGELFRVNRHSGRLGEAEVDAALDGAKRVFGVDAGKARLAPGHGGRVEVHLDPDSVQAIMSKTGVRAFTHSLSEYSPEGIANIVESGALKSTSIRWTEGIGKAGQSSSTDVMTGGADYVFTRPVRAAPTRSYSPTFTLDAEDMLSRTDWFAYSGDRFGAQNPLYRDYADDVARRDNLRNLSSGVDNSGAEVMFKHRTGFGPKDRLLLNDRDDRDQVLAILRGRGITQVAGTPIDQFVVLSTGGY